MQKIKLTPHPAARVDVVLRIEVNIDWLASGMLKIAYCLEGEIDRLRLPAVSAPRRRDKLWQHTCFEAFVTAENFSSYHEFNFAPSAAWAAYRFSAYRDGMAEADVTPPSFSMFRDAKEMNLETTVDLTDLSDLQNCAELRLALSAVIEDNDGRLSYWAIAHPSGKPDFHHADSFALTLNRRGSLP
jgi:hypothetical protein